MGADLYIESEYEPNRAKWEPKFHTWVEKRDALRQSGKSAEADRAQKKARKYFEKMYERGYFRDSYNSSNLLWLFELSWWEDVGQLLDGNGELPPEKAAELSRMLRDREPAFEANLEQVERDSGKKTRQYFADKYERFKAFLQRAMEIQESIVCSI